MCRCNPRIKTPWCGKAGCEIPIQKKERVNTIYVPVQMFVRISRKENETAERALLVARREDGREYIFAYESIDGDQDLIVCDFVSQKLAPWNDPSVQWVCENHPTEEQGHLIDGKECGGAGMPAQNKNE